ncbi:MAG: hypothetical protein ABJM06_10150 [Gilvibacter sp.]
MKTIYCYLILFLLLLVSSNSTAQSRIGGLALPTPVFDLETQKPLQFNEKTHLILFDENNNALAINSGALSIGLNIMFEEELEPKFRFIDLFAYDISFNYNLGRFDLIMGFENFLNLGQREAEVIPIPEFSNQIVSQITYELDSPYALTIGFTFTF